MSDILSVIFIGIGLIVMAFCFLPMLVVTYQEGRAKSHLMAIVYILGALLLILLGILGMNENYVRF